MKGKISEKFEELKKNRRNKKWYKNRYRKKYEIMCRRNYTQGKLGLIIFSTIIPLLMVVAILIIPFIGKINYTPSEQMESMGITIIGIAVSVWIGLNIYNAVSVNDLESALSRLDNIETLFKRYCFLSELEKTRSKYEISGYLYDEFEKVNDDEINFAVLFEIEKRYLQCSKSYEDNMWVQSQEQAQDTIFLISAVKYKKSVDDIVKQYLDIRLSDMYFYKNISVVRSGDGDINKREMDKSILLYSKILNEIENSDIDKDVKDKYLAFILNTQGYSRYMTHKDDYEEVKKAQEELKQAVKLNNKGRYCRNLGLIYSHYIRKGHKDEDYSLFARNEYKNAIDKDKDDFKAYVNYASNILQGFDVKFGLNGRKKIIPELTIKPDKEDICELQNCIKYLEIAKGISSTFEDVYFNLGKAYMYKFLFDQEHNKKDLQDGLRYAETTQVLSEGNVSCLYIIRNLYECLKEIRNAQDINEKLNGKGDSKDMEQLYIGYMKKRKN